MLMLTGSFVVLHNSTSPSAKAVWVLRCTWMNSSCWRAGDGALSAVTLFYFLSTGAVNHPLVKAVMAGENEKRRRRKYHLGQWQSGPHMGGKQVTEELAAGRTKNKCDAGEQSVHDGVLHAGGCFVCGPCWPVMDAALSPWVRTEHVWTQWEQSSFFTRRLALARGDAGAKINRSRWDDPPPPPPPNQPTHTHKHTHQTPQPPTHSGSWDAPVSNRVNGLWSMLDLRYALL